MPCIRNIQSYFKRQAAKLINFYDSELGQAIYSWRSTSVEPLIEHIKDVFKIESFTGKRMPESSCNRTTIGINLSNHGLLQLYNR